MNISLRLLVVSLIFVETILASPIAGATQGYFTIGTGVVDDGLAGAGVALPQDSTIGAVNPAGIVRVGNQYAVSGVLFQPSRQYTVTGTPSGSGFGLAPGTVKSNDNNFGIPDIAYTHRLTTSSALGFNIYANGGLDTDYPGAVNAGTFGGGPAGVDLEQLFIVPSYSVAVNKSWSVGASLVGAYQIFSASGLAAFGGYTASGTHANLTNNGDDSSFSVGGKLGVLYNATSKLTLGAVYQSKTAGGKFSKYSDLFAGHGSFNVPSTTLGGLAWKTSPSSVLAADVQFIEYSDIAAVSDPFANLFSGSPSGALGGSNGAGFGWRNTTYYKLGFQKDVSPTWTLRAGIAYGAQPVRPSEVLFNILAPGVTEWHYAIGASDKITKTSELSLAATYAPTSTVSGTVPSPMEPVNPQTIALSMHQFEIELGYSVKY